MMFVMQVAFLVERTSLFSPALFFFEKHFYYELLQWLVTLRRYV